MAGQTAHNSGYIGLYGPSNKSVGIKGKNAINTNRVHIYDYYYELKKAYGLYATTDGTGTNTGDITILHGKSIYGMYGEEGATLNNGSSMTIRNTSGTA